MCRLCGVVLFAYGTDTWSLAHVCALVSFRQGTVSRPACPHTEHLGACCMQGPAPVCVDGWWELGPLRGRLARISHRSV